MTLYQMDKVRDFVLEATKLLVDMEETASFLSKSILDDEELATEFKDRSCSMRCLLLDMRNIRNMVIDRLNLTAPDPEQRVTLNNGEDK